MCGRYTLSAEDWELAERFGFQLPNWTGQANYNIAPSQQVTVVTDQGQRQAEKVRWGLIPFWAKDTKIGFKMINARAETLASSGAFKYALQQRRCLVLADSFYEWKREHGKKIPMRIGINTWEPFAFAGLWESWKDQETGEEIRSCTIITCPANESIQTIHGRMPVILSETNESTWLDQSLDATKVAEELLIPYPAKNIDMYPVSNLVNSVKNNSRECIRLQEEHVSIHHNLTT